jgi:hypothetical protein
MVAPPNKWHQYGFERSPYSTEAIKVSEDGAKLLVGRDNELGTILSDLNSGAQVIALEGDYGVGKTSLAAVAAYEASTWRADGGPLFLPVKAEVPLRLSTTETPESFEKKVYMRIAGTLLLASASLKSEGRHLEGLERLRRWLQSPEGGGWAAGIGASMPASLGLTFSGGRTKTPNTSGGFSDTGVITLIDSWLAELFPTPECGGVICFIDNLEELENVENAVKVFEPLRDTLLRRPGLRWIVSGAEGMVRTAFSTPKMSGVFQEPIPVLPLHPDLVPSVISARADILKQDDSSVLPVSADAFEKVYLAIGKNLRFALGLADKYAMRADPSHLRTTTAAKRDQAFDTYVLNESNKVVGQLGKKIGAADWKTLGVLVREKAGSCSPGEFSDFGYTAMPPLLTRVKSLREAGLVRYTTDESDLRRRIITAENNGRLAYYSRLRSEEELHGVAAEV